MNLISEDNENIYNEEQKKVLFSKIPDLEESQEQEIDSNQTPNDSSEESTVEDIDKLESNLT